MNNSLAEVHPELNVVQMVENMRDQAMPNGVIINDAYCDRSMTRDYDREGGIVVTVDEGRLDMHIKKGA